MLSFYLFEIKFFKIKKKGKLPFEVITVNKLRRFKNSSLNLQAMKRGKEIRNSTKHPIRQVSARKLTRRLDPVARYFVYAVDLATPRLSLYFFKILF